MFFPQNKIEGWKTLNSFFGGHISPSDRKILSSPQFLILWQTIDSICRTKRLTCGTNLIERSLLRLASFSFFLFFPWPCVFSTSGQFIQRSAKKCLKPIQMLGIALSQKDPLRLIIYHSSCGTVFVRDVFAVPSFKKERKVDNKEWKGPSWCSFILMGWLFFSSKKLR